MGTRSDIIVHCGDGMWRRIYCHWDGYLSHNGRILFEHYKDQAKCEQLVALGDLSSLGEEIGEKHDFDARYKLNGKALKQFQAKHGKSCTAYGRDRGESNVDATVAETLDKAWPGPDSWTEFTYVWAPLNDGHKWYVGDPDGDRSLIDLGEALAADEKGENVIKSLVKTPFGAIGKRA